MFVKIDRSTYLDLDNVISVSKTKDKIILEFGVFEKINKGVGGYIFTHKLKLNKKTQKLYKDIISGKNILKFGDKVLIDTKLLQGKGKWVTLNIDDRKKRCYLNTILYYDAEEHTVHARSYNCYDRKDNDRLIKYIKKNFLKLDEYYVNPDLVTCFEKRSNSVIVYVGDTYLSIYNEKVFEKLKKKYM